MKHPLPTIASQDLEPIFHFINVLLTRPQQCLLISTFQPPRVPAAVTTILCHNPSLTSQDPNPTALAPPGHSDQRAIHNQPVPATSLTTLIQLCIPPGQNPRPLPHQTPYPS